MAEDQLIARRAQTQEATVTAAVDHLKAELGNDGSSVVLFFCSATYDLDELAQRMRSEFPGTVLGCTGAGVIGPAGYARTGISALKLTSTKLRVRPHLISLSGDYASAAHEVAERALAELRAGDAKAGFAFMIVDGLSRAEEPLAAAVYRSIGAIPTFGGSAGDDERFEKTLVYADGQFHDNAAMLAVFETTLPFVTFKAQSVETSEEFLVVTMADEDHRIAYEFNGEPAAEVYADLLGLAVEQLDATVFSRHPLLLTIEGEHYVRAIQRVNADLSLTLYCAIEEGVVLTLGRSSNALSTLQRTFDSMDRQLSGIEAVIGCDCFLRRVELEQTGQVGPVGRYLAERRVVGFGAYGEQYNGLHVNQTLTGVALGGRAP